MGVLEEVRERCEVESPDSDEEATMEDHEMDEGVSEGSDEDLVDGNASFT